MLHNGYPHDRLEILILDGQSSDDTAGIAGDYCKKFPCIRLVENPGRIQAAAMNIGIKLAKGSIILRMDAHSIYEKNYILNCVKCLEEYQADNVGGIQKAVGSSYITNAIATAMSSPFGIGNAHYRYLGKTMKVDTVYLGAWRKELLEMLGGFRDGMAVNEDYELNYRIRKSGGKIMLCPQIRCEYYVRKSLAGLIKQYFRYGMWKVLTLTIHPLSLKPRQIVAPVFVFCLLFSIAVLPANPLLDAIIPVLYITSTLVASTAAAYKKGWQYLPMLPVIFSILHIAWGIGFWCGLFKFAVPHLFNINKHKKYAKSK